MSQAKVQDQLLQMQHLQLLSSVVYAQQTMDEQIKMQALMIQSITHAIGAENTFLQECNRVNSKLQIENKSLHAEVSELHDEVGQLQFEVHEVKVESQITKDKLTKEINVLGKMIRDLQRYINETNLKQWNDVLFPEFVDS